MAVHLEKLAQLPARVGAAETVGAQREEVVRRQEGAELIGKSLHVIGGRHDRTRAVAEALFDIAQLRFGFGVQHVPALGIKPVAAQLIEAGDAPDVGRDAEVLFEQFGSGNHLAQDGAAAQELHLGLVFLGLAFAEQVHPLEDAFLHAFRHRRMSVVLVHHRDVIVNVLLLPAHAAQSVLDDHRKLVGKRRVIGHAVGKGRGEDVAVAVLMLQPLAVQRSASRRTTEQKAARAHVARRPGQIADALKAEHRIEDVERNHRQPIGAVRRRGGDPGAHRARFADALLQDLAVLVLLVEHQLVGVLRRIELTDVGIDAELAEHAFHAESARLVRHDRHHQLADLLVANDGAENPHERHGGRNFAALGAFELSFKRGQRRHFEGRGVTATRRQQAAHCLHPFHKILYFRRILRRPVKRHLLELVIGDRHLEAVAECLDRGGAHLLLLMGDVLALARLAHAVALHGLRQDHRGLAHVLHRRRIRRVDLVRIVSAAVQAPDIVVRHVGNHIEQFRILAEEVLAHKRAVLRLESLILAVNAFLHALQQDAALVAHEQRVPVRAPDHLDHVPAGAAETGFELLDDLAVAAHRPVEALQVAVDDKDQVVEFLAPGKRNCAERFGLVHLAVAHERPHFAALRLDNAAVFDIAHEARLVDRHEGPKAHRHRRELPEIRHEPRMRIGRQALAFDFAAEIVELLFRDAALEISARVDARRRMPLDVDQVAKKVIVGGAEKVVEADIVERGGGGEARDMAAELRRFLVGAHHHRHRVPTHQRPNLVLDLRIPRRALLLGQRNGVHVRRVGVIRNISAGAARPVHQFFEQEMRAVVAFVFEHRFQRFQPFPSFLRIGVRKDVSHIHGGHLFGVCHVVLSDTLGAENRGRRLYHRIPALRRMLRRRRERR